MGLPDNRKRVFSPASIAATGALTVLVLLAAADPAVARELVLLRSPMANPGAPGYITGATEAAYETGAIPTAVVSQRMGFSPLERIGVSAGFTFASFHQNNASRISEIDAAVHYSFLGQDPLIPIPYLATGFAYAGLYATLGEAVTESYEGNQSLVHTVVAEHGDRGLDLYLGGLLSSDRLWTRWPVKLSFGAEYARTGLRDYYVAFESRGYRNRVRFNLTPFVDREWFQVFGRPTTVALQNRLTLWFQRGTMYELLPQVTVEPRDGLHLTAGISAPVVGGRVFKFLIEGRYGLETPYRRMIRIQVPEIHFPPDKAIIYGPENEQSAENRERIERLYRRLRRHRRYHIRVEGHTSWVYWDDTERGPVEQEEVLIPLSEARAEAVMEALVELGIDPDRIDFVGKGGSEPVVPFDHPEQWRNRRVEVVLERS